MNPRFRGQIQKGARPILVAGPFFVSLMVLLTALQESMALGRSMMAHPGPPVVLDVEIQESETVFEIRGERTVLHRWLEIAPSRDPSQATDHRALLEALRKKLGQSWILEIDRQAASPQSIEVFPSPELMFGDEPGTVFRLTYPTSKAPRRLRIVWQQEFGDGWEEAEALPLHFLRFGRHEFHRLTESEPECVWHARGRERHRPEAQSPETLPQATESPSPWLSIVLLLVTGLVTAIVPSKWRLWTLGAGLVLSLITWPSVKALWTPSLPDESTALSQFEERHRSLYDAFQAGSEEEAYELLARSLSKEAIDSHYQRLFQAMILRQEGGAVCQVEKIDVLERQFVPDQAPPRDLPKRLAEEPGYGIIWEWKVHGVVRHFSHEHRRLIHAKARYWLCQDGSTWKIAHAEILEQRREDL